MAAYCSVTSEVTLGRFKLTVKLFMLRLIWFLWPNSLLTLYSPVVTMCTAILTFNNSTFCPHSVFMCFEWI